jgi:ABC-type bacteriocin/lantibiotic exporter with double-glycine peptidase domain
MVKIKTKVHEQEKSGTCGPASLKSVLHYYGKKVEEKKLVKLSKCTIKKGVEAKDLIKAAKKLGFDGFYKDKATLKEIKAYLKKKIPVIVDYFHEDDGHYGIVLGIEKNKVHLTEPEQGKLITKNKKDFERCWFDFKGDKPVNSNIYTRRMLVVYPKS